METKTTNKKSVKIAWAMILKKSFHQLLSRSLFSRNEERARKNWKVGESEK
jgi:hypothetical protein